MKRLLLLLLPVALFAGQARYARLGQFEGKVEVQLHPGDPWIAAERNLPLTESAWLRTGASSRLEIELDEGSAWRLGPESQIEISDYSRLSTGQHFTVLSLDHGVAYFTGEPGGADTLMLVTPGAHVTLLGGARVRLQVDAASSRISVIEGVVRLSCPAAELDLREGQTVRVDPANTARFWLDREVPAMDLDRWNEDRDKALAASSSGSHVSQRYGVVDLDGAGEWVQTDVGAVWKPKVAEGWAPFQNGRWRWYDAVGYTWVSDESWGWIPYHHGRWTRKGDLGWVWIPAASPVFKPGDVYWLYNSKLAGWGPLAPAEDWQPSAAPEQFLNVNTTYASFHQDARTIDPAGFKDRPKEPLGVAIFVLALPSPALPASRLEATRPLLRVGATRLNPVVPGTTFPDNARDTNDVPPPAPPQMPPAVVTNPASDAPPNVSAGPAPDPGPPGPPMQVIYPVPVYTGIVVLNPPEHPDYSRRNPNSQGSKKTPAPAAPAPVPLTPPAAGPPPPATSRTTPLPPAGRPGSASKPSPTPPAPTITTATTPPTVPNAPPRVNLPAPRPTAPPLERTSPVPTPVGRDLPRVHRPSEPKPENKPEAKPAPKADDTPDAKASPRQDTSRASKK